jgi:hypothetical protein
MKSKEFLNEAPIDQVIQQAQTQPNAKSNLPYNQNQNKVSNFVGKAAIGTVNKIGSLAGGLNAALQAGKSAGLGGVSVAYKGPPEEQQKDRPLGGNKAPDDSQVVDHLKNTANNQPLKQATGNQGIDTLLKNAGLLK